MLLASCSDSVDYNTGKAVVQFKSTSVEVKENKEILYVPLEVAGEQNGVIELDVQIIENDPNCKKDEAFIVTSTHLNIPANKQEVSLEIFLTDDHEINPDRTFQLMLSDVKGAAIGEGKLANVTIKDNDDDPYERLGGTWVITADNLLADQPGTVTSWETKLICKEEGESGYYHDIIMSPWASWDGTIPVFDEEGQTLVHPMTFHLNSATGVVTLDLPLGSIMAHDVDFGQGEGGIDLSKATVRSATAGMTGLVFNGTVTATVNEDFDEINFNLPVYGIIFSNAGSPYSYFLGFDKIKMTLKK